MRPPEQSKDCGFWATSLWVFVGLREGCRRNLEARQTLVDRRCADLADLLIRIIRVIRGWISIETRINGIAGSAVMGQDGQDVQDDKLCFSHSTISTCRPRTSKRPYAIILSNWAANWSGRFTRSTLGSLPSACLQLGRWFVLIYRVERLESTTAALRARGWTPESGPFEIPNGPCYTFRDPTGVRLAIYENQRPEVDQEFAGRIDAKN
jgi:hypothetical protein